MELEYTEETPLMPESMVGQKEIFKVVLNEETHDCVKEILRTSKRNGGEFKQYTLFLENKEKELRVANYLFLKHLGTMLKEVSKITTDWANTYVEITGVPREDKEAGKTYYDLQISPAGSPQWAEEKVE